MDYVRVRSGHAQQQVRAHCMEWYT